MKENIDGKVGVFMNDSSKMQKSNVRTSFTESWVPVKAISNGEIILDNKMKVTGVKIKPRNIFILDSGSQDAVIIALKNFYNTIDFDFWLISADRPVDIAGYLAKLQLLYEQTPSPAIKKLIIQDINKANSFTDNNVTDTEYYILFKEKSPEMIQKNLRTLIMGLSNCGLTANQVSNDDLRVILDNFLNGGVSFDFKVVMS